MLHELRLFFCALEFLTRLRAPAWLGLVPNGPGAPGASDTLQRSLRHVAGVGLCVGAFAALLLWASAHWWPALLAVLLSMAATAWLTGAFHERRLASSCDALALLFVLSLKAAALHGLAVRDLMAVLVLLPLAHTSSRCGAVLLLRWLRTPLQVDGNGLAVALVWAVLAGAAAAPFVSAEVLLAAVLAAAAATALVGRWLQQRGGLAAASVDAGWGVAQQLIELAVYMAALAAMSRG